jgi:uncharacterized membrane protein YfhO
MRFQPADRPRLLFVSSIHRPEWRATSGGRALNIEPVAGAFLGVTVPPGVEEVELAFVPRTRAALAWASSLTMIVLVGAFAMMTYRRRRQR